MEHSGSNLYPSLVTPELFRQWKSLDGARSISRESQPWPTSIIPVSHKSEVGLELAASGWGKGKRVHTGPQHFTMPMKAPKIPSLSHKLFDTSPSGESSARFYLQYFVCNYSHMINLI